MIRRLSVAPSRACWRLTRQCRWWLALPMVKWRSTIEMPVMDGMTALPLLLRADPGLKVVMASTLTTRGADIALRAVRLGAADYVPKPTAVTGDEVFRRELVEKVKAHGRMRRRVNQPVRETA